MIQTVHFILYVEDQRASVEFYRHVLADAPTLNVPGMTEFALPGGARLGLMPKAGVERLLNQRFPDPADAACPPGAELYLLVDRADLYMERAERIGGTLISPLVERDWGHCAGYVSDPDGHVLAFAEIRSASSLAIDFAD